MELNSISLTTKQPNGIDYSNSFAFRRIPANQTAPKVFTQQAKNNGMSKLIT